MSRESRGMTEDVTNEHPCVAVQVNRIKKKSYFLEFITLQTIVNLL